MEKLILVKSTCPTLEVAQEIATLLVEEKLAACVNIMPAAISVYRWQEEIEQDSEFQLQIKTSTELYPRLQDKIIELHPYEVPEIIALAIVDGHQPYLDWITENLTTP